MGARGVPLRAHQVGVGTLSVAALQQGLRGTPAAPLVGLVGVIRAVEHEGERQGWKGLAKRNAAVHHLQSAASLQRAVAGPVVRGKKPLVRFVAVSMAHRW